MHEREASCPDAAHRLGPLAVEQKKRAVGKRAKFEKNKEDERRPQEMREEDIARSENETTKHVIDVSRASLILQTNKPSPQNRYEAYSWSKMAP